MYKANILPIIYQGVTPRRSNSLTTTRLFFLFRHFFRQKSQSSLATASSITGLYPETAFLGFLLPKERLLASYGQWAPLCQLDQSDLFEAALLTLVSMCLGIWLAYLVLMSNSKLFKKCKIIFSSAYVFWPRTKASRQ